MAHVKPEQGAKGFKPVFLGSPGEPVRKAHVKGSLKHFDEPLPMRVNHNADVWVSLFGRHRALAQFGEGLLYNDVISHHSDCNSDS